MARPFTDAPYSPLGNGSPGAAPAPAIPSLAGTNYGTPPYHDSSLRARLRMALSGIGPGLVGLGAVPHGANFGEAFLAAAGASSKASQAAHMAAQAYADKVMQAQQDAEDKAQAEQDRKDQLGIAKAHLVLAQKAADATKPSDSATKYKELIGQGVDATTARQIAYGLTAAEKLTEAKAIGGAKAAATAGPGMSDEALNQAADFYATTGQLGGFGMGASPERDRVRDRAALRHPGTDIAANKAAFQKDQGAYKTLQQVRDLSGGWENTVIANGKVLLETMRHIPEAGNMPMNFLLRHGATLLGSDQMAAFNAARETFKNEAARLLNQPGGTGGAVLSDAARREVEKIASGNLTGRQMQASLDIVKRDATNKRTGYDRQIQQIRSRIKTRFGVSPDLDLSQPQQSGPQSFIYDPATGEMTPAQ